MIELTNFSTSDNLFYGNLNAEQDKMADSMLPYFDSILDYFTQESFSYEQYNPMEELEQVIQTFENTELTDDDIKMDEDINRYLHDKAVELGVDKEYLIEMEKALEQLNPFVLQLKEYWNRARPEQYAYLYGVDWYPEDTVSGHTPSFPSGHTIYGEAWSYLVSKKLGTQESAIAADIANDVNKSRIKMGLHFPSDIYFGKIVVQRMIENDLLKDSVDKYKTK